MNTEQATETYFSTYNDTCSVSTLKGKDPKKGERTLCFEKVHSHFKSPFQVNGCDQVSHAENMAELQRRRNELDIEIGQLEAKGYRVEELDHHIDMLHEYNDIKDIGQSLLGRIAALRGMTTRDLYSHFGLELDD